MLLIIDLISYTCFLLLILFLFPQVCRNYRLLGTMYFIYFIHFIGLTTHPLVFSKCCRFVKDNKRSNLSLLFSQLSLQKEQKSVTIESVASHSREFRAK